MAPISRCPPLNCLRLAYLYSLPESLILPPSLRRGRRDPWEGWRVRRTAQQNPWKTSHARIVWVRGLRDSNPVVMPHSTAMSPVNGSNLQVSTFELSSFSLFILEFFLFYDWRECFKPPVGRLPYEKDGSARRTWYMFSLERYEAKALILRYLLGYWTKKIDRRYCFVLLIGISWG